MSQHKGPGRPRVYPKRSDQDRGAPLLGLRLEPTVHQHIKNHPEGARPYVERLVKEDIVKHGSYAVASLCSGELAEQGTHKPLVDESTGDLPLAGDAEQAAEALQ